MKKHTTLKSKINSAFSLVELLVVIAVIAVIAAIAIPNITGTRDAAQAASDSYSQAEADRFNTQLRAMGYTGTAYTVTAFREDNEGRCVEFTEPNTQRVITFKLD